MDALKFLEEEKFENRVLFVTDDGRQITLLQILEEFKERILNQKDQFVVGQRVFLKNDPSGKRYRITGFDSDTNDYYLYLHGNVIRENYENITPHIEQ